MWKRDEKIEKKLKLKTAGHSVPRVTVLDAVASLNLTVQNVQFEFAASDVSWLFPDWRPRLENLFVSRLGPKSIPSFTSPGSFWRHQQIRPILQTSSSKNPVKYCIREHLKGKYHFTVDLLFDWFRNVPLCSTKFSAPSAKYISKLVVQEVNRTAILPL